MAISGKFFRRLVEQGSCLNQGAQPFAELKYNIWEPKDEVWEPKHDVEAPQHDIWVLQHDV